MALRLAPAPRAPLHRIGLRLDCWAIFEGAAFTITAPAVPVEPDHPDLVAVAREFGLTVAFGEPG